MSDREQRQKNQLESSALFSILESAAQGIVGVDTAGTMVFVNAAAGRLFGYQRSEMLGQPIAILIPEKTRDVHSGWCSSFMCAPEIRPMGVGRELLARRKDGSQFPAEIALSHAETARGPLGVAFISDVSERRRMEEERLRQQAELERSHAVLQEFAYSISHDLQEPARNVKGFAEVLGRRYGYLLDDDGKAFVGYISGGANRMIELIHGLLAYSRVTHGEVKFVEVNLHRVAMCTIEDLRTTIEDCGATVTVDPLPIVIGDEVQLRQLLQNLIANGIRYRSRQPPLIRISTAAQDSALCTIAVEDNGMGIDPKFHESAFRVFTRLAPEIPGGTGVGLAICRQVVERHGGRIWIESRAGGTTMKFCLRTVRGSSGLTATNI